MFHRLPYKLQLWIHFYAQLSTVIEKRDVKLLEMRNSICCIEFRDENL